MRQWKIIGRKLGDSLDLKSAKMLSYTSLRLHKEFKSTLWISSWDIPRKAECAHVWFLSSNSWANLSRSHPTRRCKVWWNIGRTCSWSAIRSTVSLLSASLPAGLNCKKKQVQWHLKTHHFTMDKKGFNLWMIVWYGLVKWCTIQCFQV